MLDLLTINPCRPPDAWFRRAIRIVDRGDPAASVALDGRQGRKWIDRAVDYLKGLDRADSDRQRLRGKTKNRAIATAHAIYLDMHGPHAKRWPLEARILARQTDQKIAQAVACNPGTAQAYHAMFFNVRDRLDALDWVAAHVIDPRRVLAGAAGDAAYVLRAAAYYGGPHVLDAVISGFHQFNWEEQEDIFKVLGHFQGEVLGVKAFAAALLVDVHRAPLAFMRKRATLERLARIVPSDEAATAQLEEGTRAVHEFLAAAYSHIDNLPALVAVQKMSSHSVEEQQPACHFSGR